MALVQANTGANNTGATSVAATLTTPATAGNLLVVITAANATATPPTGFTQSAGCGQVTFLGHYLWWAVAAGGETTLTYTLGASTTSSWIAAEYSGIAAAPYDVSAGQFAQSPGSTYTTPAVTPTAGSRLVLATVGGSLGSSGLVTTSAWLNGFTLREDSPSNPASGTWDLGSYADLSGTYDGGTAVSSGATFNVSPEARTGITIAFKLAATGHIAGRVGQYGDFTLNFGQ